MMKYFLLAILLLASVGFVKAQTGGTVVGTVKQGTDVEGQALVNLRSNKDPKIEFNTTADVAGKFEFDNVPPGKYTVSSGGRANSGREVGVIASAEIAVRTGETRMIDLELDRYPIRQTVTISADQPQPIDQVSKTVNTINAQEMRDRADFTLVDSLRSIPGFRVQQLGGFGKTASIKTRGLRNQDTAVLIDGIRFRDPSAITGDASPFISDFTLTSVSKIEVLRGSGSSLYGTNAIGGVIDFQTPQPRSGLHGQISGAVGGLGLGRFRGNISDATKNGKFGFNAGVSRTVYTKGIDGDDDANNTNFQSRFDFNLATGTSLSGRFFFSDAFVRLNSNPDTINATFNNLGVIDASENVNFVPDADDPDDTQGSRYFNGQFVISQTINPRLYFNAYYSGLSTKRRNVSGPLGVGFQSASTSIFDGAIHTVNGHLSWSPNSIHSVTAGYEFEYEHFGNEGLTPTGSSNFFTRAAQSSHTIYAQDLISLYDGHLQLAGGVRAQFFSLSSPSFSLNNAPYSDLSLQNPPTAVTFDGSAAYNFRSTGTKLRTHVGSGYRVPSLFERFGTFFDDFSEQQAFVALGDPNLRPERSIATDGGIEQIFANEKVKFTAVYFYTKLIDTIGFGNSVPDIGTMGRPFGGYENQKGGIARGAEFSGTFKPTVSTDIFASYTFTNSDQRTPQVSGSGVLKSLGIPDHQVTLVATQRIKKFWVNFDLLLASSYLAPIFSNETFNSYVYRFNGNRRGDITAGYTFGWKQEKLSLRLFGTIENVFDDKYFENGFKTPGRNARIGLNFGF